MQCHALCDAKGQQLCVSLLSSPSLVDRVSTRCPPRSLVAAVAALAAAVHNRCSLRDAMRCEASCCVALRCAALLGLACQTGLKSGRLEAGASASGEARALCECASAGLVLAACSIRDGWVTSRRSFPCDGCVCELRFAARQRGWALFLILLPCPCPCQEALPHVLNVQTTGSAGNERPARFLSLFLSVR